MVRQGTPFSLECILRWARQMAQGLSYIHQKGFAHLDIKPENVLVFVPDRKQRLDEATRTNREEVLSLVNTAVASKDDILLFQAYTHAGFFFARQDTYMAGKVFRKALDFAKRSKDEGVVLEASLNMGEFLLLAGEYNEARVFLEQSLLSASTSYDRAGQLRASEGLGFLHRVLGDKEASDSFYDAVLCEEGVCKLADLGTCTNVKDPFPPRCPGTLSYMAPELHQGGVRGEALQRSDLFSLGVTLVTMCCCFPPIETTQKRPVREREDGERFLDPMVQILWEQGPRGFLETWENEAVLRGAEENAKGLRNAMRLLPVLEVSLQVDPTRRGTIADVLRALDEVESSLVR